MTTENTQQDMILVSGVPRSGTTWISRVLSMSDSTTYYYEPDNEHNSLLGYIYKQHLHRFPYLREHDGKSGLYNIYRDVLADRYIFDYTKMSLLIKKLFGINLESVELEVIMKCNHLDRERGSRPQYSYRHNMKVKLVRALYYFFQIFEGHNRNQKLPLVKSVHSVLSLPYLQSYFNTRNVIVLRHPANIIASHLRLDNRDMYRNIFSQEKLVQDYLQPYIKDIESVKDPIEKAGTQVAAIYHVLAKQLQNNSDWIVVTHEDFCRDPQGEFKKMYDRLDLNWTEDVRDKIEAMNRSGDGYTPARVAEKQINKWKRELEPDQVEKIRRGYATIKPTFYKELAYQKVESRLE